VRRLIIISLLACMIGCLGGALATASGRTGSALSGATVLTQTTYPNATPQHPEGMPSQAAANEAGHAASQSIEPTSSPGVIVLTQTTYPNATPQHPEGIQSQAAANEADSVAGHPAAKP
jgi:hypothetical protein